MSTVSAGIAASVAGGAAGQLLMKSGISNLAIGSPSELISSISIAPGALLLVILGISAYVFAMLIWIHTLKHLKLSVAYPLLSLGYVLVYFAAAFLPGFNESLSVQKTIGIALIIFGVWYAQSGDSSDAA